MECERWQLIAAIVSNAVTVLIALIGWWRLKVQLNARIRNKVIFLKIFERIMF